VLDRAFRQVQAVVVLLTGDDLASLREPFLQEDDGAYERIPTPQARPNVLLEAGMALGRHPQRTIISCLGKVRPLSPPSMDSAIQPTVLHCVFHPGMSCNHVLAQNGRDFTAVG
jgi:hypothetical protein